MLQLSLKHCTRYDGIARDGGEAPDGDNSLPRPRRITGLRD